MTVPALVRRTTTADGPVLRQMRIAALTDAPYAFGAKLEDVLAESPESFSATALRHGNSDTATSFLLFVADEPAGTIGAFFEQAPPGRAFICALWLAPQFRGSLHGAALLASATDWLFQRGAREIHAWVADANKRAMNFYARRGFHSTSTQQPLPSNPAESETLLVRAKDDGGPASRSGTS